MVGSSFCSNTAAFALSHQDPDEMDLMDTGAPEADAPLADWLALARACADHAGAAEGRSRSALYRAIGLAYGFALVAQLRPHDSAELLEDSGNRKRPTWGKRGSVS